LVDFILFFFITEEENDKEDNEGALALANATQKVLRLRDDPKSLIKGTARSGPEYFASRSYQGLDMHCNNSLPESYLTGRSGRASGYRDEKGKHEEK
jgi:diphthamide biosynthesis protein 2